MISGMQGLQVFEIDLAWSDFSDEDAEALCDIPGLTRLHLERTPITDEACRSIAKIEGLDELDANFTAIGDVGVAHLATSQSLTRLSLGKYQGNGFGTAESGRDEAT